MYLNGEDVVCPFCREELGVDINLQDGLIQKFNHQCEHCELPVVVNFELHDNDMISLQVTTASS
jgi:hypothetical protein